jgi:hypothetical protein
VVDDPRMNGSPKAIQILKNPKLGSFLYQVRCWDKEELTTTAP